MTDNEIRNIRELNDKRNKKEILTECISELELNKNSACQFIVCIIIALALSIYIAFYADTVRVTGIVVSVLLDVQLAFFAVIFGAYAIFQALMRDEIIRELIKTDNNILKDSNRTFLNLSILYILDVFITVVINIVVNMCSEEFYIYDILLSDILFAVPFFVYCAMNFILMMENINFVINFYRMFNVYNIYRALDVMDDEK